MVERAKFRERRSYIPSRCITAPQPLVRGDDANVSVCVSAGCVIMNVHVSISLNQFQYDFIEKFFDFI